MRSISVLGSTGSIGTQTLDVVRNNDDMQVAALCAGNNTRLLEKQMREFHPKIACVKTEEAARDLSLSTKDLGIPILCGDEGLIEAASTEVADTVVTAVVGMLAVKPTIAAIRSGKRVCQANKESIVTAGHIIMPLVKELGSEFIPVDSEHSAIFQCLNGERENGSRIDKILLTASGGPFFGRKKAELEAVTPEQALRHPRWNMGKKISIDSSTLVNKGLEVMEAKWLFGVSIDQIQVVVHPQSIIHSMVQFEDGAIMAQLGPADMRIPIQYALTYPKRRELMCARADLFDIGQLTFARPDMETFPGLAMAFEAMDRGGNIPTVYNAANEKAVALFLEGKISYPDITDMIRYAMDNADFIADPSVEQIFDTENAVYELIAVRL